MFNVNGLDVVYSPDAGRFEKYVEKISFLCNKRYVITVYY